MATTFPVGDPELIYTRALQGETDLYGVYPGPNDIKHYGHSLVDVHNLVFEACDPLPPELLSYEQLGILYQANQAAKAALKKERTDEFEALSGLHDQSEAA
jgi:hypothetical protein